ncbi:MAG: NAD-dependent epimerase/dehydratase family protein [Pyrinomonadaceae bacterium]
MKRVLITGATGFVGANLARRLLRDGQEVHLLVRPVHSVWRIEDVREHVRLHEAALEDSESLARIVGDIRPDWIFHLAAHGAYPLQTDVRQMVSANITGTMNLVEACLKIGFEAFVNTGSSSEYGFKDHAPSEEELLEPNSNYGVTKASATLFCRHTAQKAGVHLPTLRLYSVYGPYEEPTRLMPSLIVKGLRGKLPPLVSPDIARDYVYVDDVSDAYLLAATRPAEELGAIYNVGTGRQTSLSEVVLVARRAMNIEAEPQWGSMPERQWDTNVWVADSRKIQETLGWRASHSFEQGFLKMLGWFQNNPALWNFYNVSTT